MVILINHQPAVIKQGTSFDFISENSFFTGADSYSLSISFPLKGCPQNIAIFGHLYRKDCDFTDTVLDCEIHDRNFHKSGAVSIVELSDTEVKVQFLEGRSKRNYYTSMDDIFFNEAQVPEGNEIATVENAAQTAMLLFAGYIDAATSVSESCGGGGGSTPESDWGKKDDEDERTFARRCLQMAHSMYKPKSVKRSFHR